MYIYIANNNTNDRLRMIFAVSQNDCARGGILTDLLETTYSALAHVMQTIRTRGVCVGVK